MVEDAMRGDIDLAPFVTHTMGLEEINEAFELKRALANGQRVAMR